MPLILGSNTKNKNTTKDAAGNTVLKTSASSTKTSTAPVTKSPVEQPPVQAVTKIAEPAKTTVQDSGSLAYVSADGTFKLTAAQYNTVQKNNPALAAKYKPIPGTSQTQTAVPKQSYLVDPTGKKTPITSEQAASYSQGANSLAAGYSVQKATPVVAQTPAVVPTAVPPIPSQQPEAAAAAEIAPPAESVFPTIPLQPGSTGDGVKSLQDFLVSQGYMTAEQVATGPGIYGPQTTAAVAAWQQANGVDNSTGPGYWGPRSIEAAKRVSSGGTVLPSTPIEAGGTQGPGESSGGFVFSPTGVAQLSPEEAAVAHYKQVLGEQLASMGLSLPGDAENMATSNPIKFVNDLYGALYTNLGLSDVKSQYEGYVSRIEEINNELNDEISAVNDNPWLTEGIRAARINKLKEKYQGRIDSAVNSARLLESFYQDGTSQAQFLTQQTLALYNSEAGRKQDLYIRAMDNTAAIIEAEQKAMAPNYEGVRSANGGLFDVTTGQWIVPPTEKSSDGLTPYQQFQATTSLRNQTSKLNAGASELQRQVGIMNTAWKRYDSGEAADLNATSQAIITTFNKILDPTSVVRESEYDRTPQGQSLLNNIYGRISAIQQGGPGLTKASLKELVDLGNELASGAAASIAQKNAEASQIASAFGIDPGLVTTSSTYQPQGGATYSPTTGGVFSDADFNF